MKSWLYFLLICQTGFLFPADAVSQSGNKQSNAGKRTQEAFFWNQVPAHTANIIVGRPTDHSVTISIQMKLNGIGYLRYGLHPSKLQYQTGRRSFLNDEVIWIELDSLLKHKKYYYEWVYFLNDDSLRSSSSTGYFQTSRKQGDEFVFTIQADSHLDENTDTSIYLRTLQNMRNDSTDFLLDLGDTWMTDKYRTNYKDAYQQYLAQRYYFAQVGKSAAVFLALGNHDGETFQRNGNAAVENRASWATLTRNALYPNPFPNDFYSGNQEKLPDGGFVKNYYSFTWGDALVIVLDPFRYTTNNRLPWYRTLGKEQYTWLQQTLQKSKAKFKFICIHNLVGGNDDHGIARGGSEAASFYEWGGNDSSGVRTFEQHRPDFDNDIATLLRTNGVQVVFHGHDHFFAKQDRDGMVYQLVPQPGGTKYRTQNFIPEYGYRDGVMFAAPGYMRVKISSAKARIEFVQTGNGNDKQNGKILYTYEIQPQ